MTSGDSQQKPSADQDGFTSSGSKAGGGSSFAAIRQGVLVLILLAAVGGLAWEYLIALPGYRNSFAYLEQLQETYIDADVVKTNGDRDGEGIAPEFTEAAIHETIGFEPQEVKQFGEGAVEIQIFRWRRWNLRAYEVAVEFTQRGPRKTKVFTNWYADLTEIPENLARAVATPADRLSGVPDSLPLAATMGDGGGGGRGEQGGGRRRRPESTEEGTETRSEGTDMPETPAGDVPAGDVPAGDVPAGDVPAGDVPAGDVPAGDVPAGDVPAGDVPAGDVPAGDVPAGDGMN